MSYVLKCLFVCFLKTFSYPVAVTITGAVTITSDRATFRN
jgi:hypothetical protein